MSKDQGQIVATNHSIPKNMTAIFPGGSELPLVVLKSKIELDFPKTFMCVGDRVPTYESQYEKKIGILEVPLGVFEALRFEINKGQDKPVDLTKNQFDIIITEQSSVDGKESIMEKWKNFTIIEYSLEIKQGFESTASIKGAIEEYSLESYRSKVSEKGTSHTFPYTSWLNTMVKLINLRTLLYPTWIKINVKRNNSDRLYKNQKNIAIGQNSSTNLSMQLSEKQVHELHLKTGKIITDSVFNLTIAQLWEWSDINKQRYQSDIDIRNFCPRKYYNLCIDEVPNSVGTIRGPVGFLQYSIWQKPQL